MKKSFRHPNSSPAIHPGRFLRRELDSRKLSANRLALDLRVPPGRITDIVKGRRSISADTALRMARTFGTNAQFWLDLQSQYDIAVAEREVGKEIMKRVHPADAVCAAIRKLRPARRQRRARRPQFPRGEHAGVFDAVGEGGVNRHRTPKWWRWTTSVAP